MPPRPNKRELANQEKEAAKSKMAKKNPILRGEGSGSRRTVTPPIEEPTIKFKHATDQKERYNYLITRGFIGTKYMCEDALTQLGLKDDVFKFLSDAELLDFCNSARDTHERLTLEVLSSCNVLMNPAYETDPEVDQWIFVFRMFNIDHSYTMTEFGELMMLPSEGEEDVPGDYNPAEFWAEISMRDVLDNGTERPLQAKERIYDPKLAKISKIYNPVFKYTAKVLANSIFCRGLDAGGFPKSDVYFMYCMWNNMSINAALIFAKSLVRQAKTESGKIPIGGFITMLADRLNVRYLKNKLKSFVRLDVKNCIDAHWLRVKNNEYWYVYFDRDVLRFPYDPSLDFIKAKENWKPSREVLMKTPVIPTTSTEMPEDEPLGDMAHQWYNESRGAPNIPPWTPGTSSRPSHTSNDDRTYNLVLQLQQENKELRDKVDKVEGTNKSLKNYMKKSLKKLFSGLKISPPPSSDEEESGKGKSIQPEGNL